jgi:hypothetical protein
LEFIIDGVGVELEFIIDGVGVELEWARIFQLRFNSYMIGFYSMRTRKILNKNRRICAWSFWRNYMYVHMTSLKHNNRQQERMRENERKRKKTLHA